MLKGFDLCCKSAGLSCFAFCLGMVTGLCLPICVVAVIEAILILLMGYFCIFRW